MSWIAVAIGGGALLGAGASIYAGNQQARAAGNATNAEVGMFQNTQAQLQPWMQSGNVALGQINSGLQPGGQFNQPFGLSQFQASPAYQFNLQEGQKAIDKAANARGNFYAPQTLQDISKFSQGVASNEFQNAFQNYRQNTGDIWNRLYNTSQSGQNAAANLGGFGTTTAGQIGQNITGAGNAQAAGAVGAAGAVSGGVNAYTNYALMNNLLARMQQPSVGTPAGLDPNLMAG